MPQNLRNEKAIQKIELELYKEDYFKLSAYESFLNKHIELGNRIPARVLKKYFSFFITESEKRKHREKNIQLFFDKITDRFASKDYFFKGENYIYVKRTNFLSDGDFEDIFDSLDEKTSKAKKSALKKQQKRGRPRKKELVKYSSQEMFGIILQKLTLYIHKPDRWNKDRVIQFAWQEMKNYEEKYLNRADKIRFTVYKKRTLASFIATLFDFAVTSKKNPSNSDLEIAARHAIKKLQKKTEI